MSVSSVTIDEANFSIWSQHETRPTGVRLVEMNVSQKVGDATHALVSEGLRNVGAIQVVVCVL